MEDQSQSFQMLSDLHQLSGVMQKNMFLRNLTYPFLALLLCGYCGFGGILRLQN